MSLACVIPARLQSSRFPGKLLAKAQGKTVLQRTYESARQCSDLDALYVATDDEQIAEHAREMGAEVIWTSSSCQNGTERIGEAVRSYAPLQKASLIVNVQADHPCTQPATISAIAHALRRDPKASCSTAVCRLTNREEWLSPHVVKCVFDAHCNALYFSRCPIPYSASKNGSEPLWYGHIGIYCYRTPFLLHYLALGPSSLQEAEDLEQLKILEAGYRMKIALVQETLLGVDTPQDLLKLERHLCQTSSTSS